jgi:hypothetical protein
MKIVRLTFQHNFINLQEDKPLQCFVHQHLLNSSYFMYSRNIMLEDKISVLIKLI